MLHELKVVKNNTIFYYDNNTNALYDSNKRMLSKPLGLRDNRQAPNESNIRNVYKSKAPTEIKIVFGHKCNYSCGYCVQRDVGDHHGEHLPPVETKTRVEKLIENMRSHLDLSQLEQIELWGGEIFLYWSEVMGVINEFDRPDFDWVIPTNGTLLNFSHLKFVSELKGRVTIELSHDGPGHEALRGRDFLERKVEHLRFIENVPEKIRVTMNVVVSKGNFDYFSTNDFFRDFYTKHDLRPIPLTFMPIIVYDDLSRSHSFEFELTQYSSNLQDYLDAHIKQFKTSKKVISDNLIETSLFHIDCDGDDNNGILQWAAKMRSELDEIDSTICGMHQKDKLVLDINGEIKSCQNVGEDQNNGSLKDFDINPVLPINTMNPTQKSKNCDSCIVKLQCLRGCPLSLDDESFDINCRLSLAHNKTMLMASLKIIFDSDIEWIGYEENGVSRDLRI